VASREEFFLKFAAAAFYDNCDLSLQKRRKHYMINVATCIYKDA
jgi:hypothetical protein